MLFLISILLQIFSLGIGLYYIIISMFGFIPVKEQRKRADDKNRSFAVVIPAHNEETVISDLLRSLREMDYPKSLYKVFLIADNCTDSTAGTARREGSAEVLVRSSEQRGKGYALEWFFARLEEMPEYFDYVCVLDADNIADRDFLKEMNKKAQLGYDAVQGYVDSKNPYDTWITTSYTMCFRSVARIFQLPRYRLGLCCQLSGTGFILSTDIIRRIGWRARCLTEDMEFTVRLVLNNCRVAWSHSARVYDEKPLGLAASCRQRKRWMQGHWDVAARYWTKLVKKAFRDRDFAAFDCSVYLLQPVRILALGIISAFAYAETFGGHFDFLLASDIFPPFIWQAITVLQLLYLPFVLLIEQGKLSVRIIPDYIGYAVYNLTWIPIAAAGFFARKNTEWSHTIHTGGKNKTRRSHS